MNLKKIYHYGPYKAIQKLIFELLWLKNDDMESTKQKNSNPKIFLFII